MIKSIALFKGETAEREQDPYVQLLNVSDFKATIIPCLKFIFLNEEKLRNILEAADDWEGLIFTSTRAVEAVKRCLSDIPDIVISKWKIKTNYSVGASTADLAKSLLQFDTLGAETGNSENLCNFIKSNCLSSNVKPFIFPCSNIRKDTIPEVLSNEGFKVVQIVCYETISNPQLRECWNVLKAEKGAPGVLVFFSPSGVKSCQEMVKETYGKALPKILALGPSTEEALREVNMPANKVARRPQPQDVLEAIQSLFVD